MRTKEKLLKVKHKLFEEKKIIIGSEKYTTN